MQPPASTASDDEALSSPPNSHQEPGNAPQVSSWNFLILAGYQITMRTGWIFKTESVIMPAVLDYVAGAGWVRGWLPLLNRFGHSLPPLLLARRVKNTPRKKTVLFWTTAYMTILMLGMAALITISHRPAPWWTSGVFLLVYTLFFVCIGVNHLTFNTLQGKLVETTWRGRLLLLANVFGATTAVLCAFFLMPRWLAGSAPRYDLLFLMAAAMFGVSAVLAALLSEKPDDNCEPSTSFSRVFLDAAWLLRNHVQFRRLALVAAMFGTSMMLFPHYQSLGLQDMRLELKNLMWWVVIQNIGTGVFSVPAGIVADRWGNRLVLQVAMLGAAAAPVVALALRFADVGALYCLVFPLVGLTPVVIRTLQNFTLELCEAGDHPRYLSTLGLCMSVPLFFSPLVGLLIDLVGFEIVFLGTCMIVVLGWLATFSLREPRHHVNVSFLQTSD